MGAVLPASRDGTLRLWDGQSGACLAVLEGHTDWVDGALALADGRLLSWSYDATLRVWDAQSGACLAVLEGQAGRVEGALVFSDGVAELARFSADYQRRIQQTLSGSLRDVKSGSGSIAFWTLATVCFGYGVVHTLGPGHGKAA